MSGPLRHPLYPRLHLFKAPNGKSIHWYGGFHHQGKFLRQSMRTPLWSQALDQAERWYLAKRTEIACGDLKPSGGARFASVATKLLGRLRAENHSPNYTKVLATYLRPGGQISAFFGQLYVRHITSRTWDDFRSDLEASRRSAGKPQLSERSFHQLKNAVRLVLRQAYIDRQIDDIPKFVDALRRPKRDHRPRVFFNEDEFKQLLRASLFNIDWHVGLRSRWVSDARELHDYIVFMVSTGLRVSEARLLRICDVRPLIVDGVQVCEVTIVGGKRGAHPPILTFHAGFVAYRRILSRRKITDPDVSTARLFAKHHSEAFKRLLRSNSMYSDRYGRRRDFVSLRHTHICFRLISGEPIFSVARHTRTSVNMIDEHYARWLGAARFTFDPNIWNLA